MSSDTSYWIIKIDSSSQVYAPNTFIPNNDEFDQSFQPVWYAKEILRVSDFWSMGERSF